jgi:serine/threonine protein phosphatase 1
MSPVYAIGDVHGHLDLLKAAHERIARDRAQHGTGAAPVIHLGDLVDRGPESAGVIDLLIAGIAAGEPWEVLLGNHDKGLALFLDGPDRRDPGLRAEFSWLHPRIGGAATLASYGVRAPADRPVAQVWAEARDRVPPAHLAFVAGRPRHLVRGDLLFVHAGIRPGLPLADQTETDLIWIREPFLSHPDPHPWLVIHGHTALEAPCHHGNRVNIDSGAAYGGPLTAIVIEGGAVAVLGPAGRVPLNPLATPRR